MNKLLSPLIITVATILGGCAAAPEPAWKKAVAGDGPGELARIEQSMVKVSNLPKSRSGNRSEYEVFGIRYSVLESAKGFTEQGIASWYGSKFHGNATASGEIYDMHQLTAAHKHLPLPTFVRVTRLDNGKSLVVKVNDRGPFVGDRIIDLSYAAAASLDMLESGKAEVLVEALSHHAEPEQADHLSLSQLDQSPVALMHRDEPAQPQLNKTEQFSHFVQVGAFSDVDNAENLMQRVGDALQLPVLLDFESQQQVYRVQVGPLQDEIGLDSTISLLASKGIAGYPVKKANR